jgi:hypothetical protein
MKRNEGASLGVTSTRVKSNSYQSCSFYCFWTSTRVRLTPFAASIGFHGVTFLTTHRLLCKLFLAVVSLIYLVWASFKRTLQVHNGSCEKSEILCFSHVTYVLRPFEYIGLFLQ